VGDARVGANVAIFKWVSLTSLPQPSDSSDHEDYCHKARDDANDDQRPSSFLAQTCLYWSSANGEVGCGRQEGQSLLAELKLTEAVERIGAAQNALHILL